jgi:hypothetical protein
LGIDNFEGKPLNSPNHIVPHQDGGIWFTDQSYSDRLNEGHPDEAGGPINLLSVLKREVGAPNAGVIDGRRRELPTAVYRWNPSGKLETLVMRVPKRTREVAAAQATSTANWSPPCPSATHCRLIAAPDPYRIENSLEARVKMHEEGLTG